MVLQRHDGRIALVRKHHTRFFIFPGGKPEPTETGVDTAVREVQEELGVKLESDLLQHMGDYTTPAANEAQTQLLSQVYTAQLPANVPVSAQAEVAELIWVAPSTANDELPEGTTLAPLSALILESREESYGHDTR